MCRVLVVVGMEDERAIAAGEGISVVVGTANAKVLRERLSAVEMAKITVVYSFGVAGGLDPALQGGELLLSTRVVAQGVEERHPSIAASWEADPSLLAALQARARQTRFGRIREAVFLGTDFEARENPHAASATLRVLSGADVIDNESHIAAAFAREHSVPFAAVRAVSDSVHRALPPAALIALGADGKPNAAAIAKSLLRYPQQIPALIRTAREYKRALSSLASFRRDIGFVELKNGH